MEDHVVECLLETGSNAMFKASARGPSYVNAGSKQQTVEDFVSKYYDFLLPRSTTASWKLARGAGHQHQDTERLLRTCVALIKGFHLTPSITRIKTRHNGRILQVVEVHKQVFF